MSYIQKINQMISRPCAMVREVPFLVGSYAEVIREWRQYSAGGGLSVPIKYKYFISNLFDFHNSIADHVILYYSANQTDCLLLCKVGEKTIHLSIPALEIGKDHKCIVATYA